MCWFFPWVLQNLHEGASVRIGACRREWAAATRFCPLCAFSRAWDWHAPPSDGASNSPKRERSQYSQSVWKVTPAYLCISQEAWLLLLILHILTDASKSAWLNFTFQFLLCECCLSPLNLSCNSQAILYCMCVRFRALAGSEHVSGRVCVCVCVD